MEPGFHPQYIDAFLEPKFFVGEERIMKIKENPMVRIQFGGIGI